ncbi:MAG: hypothetical protein FWC87_04400 [Acidimicrobiaceae bacterium]|nr:hypothetical protein [Acidimicrobiaceae bacterium]
MRRKTRRILAALVALAAGVLGVGAPTASASSATIVTRPNANQTISEGYDAVVVTGQIGACHWSATLGAYLGVSFTRVTSYPKPGCTTAGFMLGTKEWDPAEALVGFDTWGCYVGGSRCVNETLNGGPYLYTTSLTYTKGPTVWTDSSITACGLVTVNGLSWDGCELIFLQAPTGIPV